MFKNLMKKKSKRIKEEIVAPLTGAVVKLTEVPDPIFSNKMIGDGVAVQPIRKKMKILSPVDGKIMMIPETKHAIGIKSSHGIEILIHIGLETVELKGEGFQPLVKVGDYVKTGEQLIEVDFHFIHSQGKNTITPIIVPNNEQMTADLEVYELEQVQAGRDPLFHLILPVN